MKYLEILTKKLILMLLFNLISYCSFSQRPIDTRNLPNPPAGCEIDFAVDTLDSCYNNNSIKVDIFLSIGCGPYILDFGDGTIITTNSQFNYHNYCTPGNYLVNIMYANYFTQQVPYTFWRVSNTTFTVNFKPFVDSTCYPATYSFMNLSKCVAPEFDTSGKLLNFVWDYGDGSPMDTSFDGGHLYYAKSNASYSVRLTAYINNCAVSSTVVKIVTLPWTKISSNFYHLDPLTSFKYLCENKSDSSIFFPNPCNYQFNWHPGNLVSDSTANEPIFLGVSGICNTQLSYTLRTDITSQGIYLYSDSFTYFINSDMIGLNTINPSTQILCAGIPEKISPHKAVICGTDLYYGWSPYVAGPSNIIRRIITLGDSTTYTYLTSNYTCIITAFPCSDTSFTQKFLVLGKELPPNYTYNYNSDGSVTFRVTNPFGIESHRYTWDFGNGRIDTGSQVTLNNLSGDYYVKLTVTNNCGNSNSSTYLVSILPSYNAINYNKNQCTQSSSIVGYTSTTDFHINTDQIWDSSNSNSLERKYKGTITIDSAKTLTISGITVQLGMNSKIIVKRGGRLIIQNAILRGIYKSIIPGDTCKGMWQGIEVWGNAAYNHYSNISVHGKVTISGNSQILDAHKAIFVGKRVECVPSENEFCTGTSGYVDFEPNYGGGIIDVQGCTFRRNAMDIIFTPYLPKTGNPNTNANRIRNNNFYGGKVLDPGYNTNNTVGAVPYPNHANHFYANANKQGKTSQQLKLYKVYNLGIYGNKFENATYGIDAIDSKFTVSKIGTGNGNNFQNLDYGIQSLSTLSSINFPQVISNNNFNKIKSAAIRMEGGKIITVYKNHFGSPSLFSTPTDNPRGIYMYGVSNFNIVDNDFYRLDTSIFILESGIEGGKISSDQQDGNIFTQCKLGVMTSGNNQNLQIRCNKNLNNSANDYINRNWNIAGSLKNQGSNVDHTSLAGNEFRPSDTKDLYSTTPFNYFAHARAADNTLATIPTVAIGSTGWDTLNIQKTGFVKQNNSCTPPPPCYPNCNLALAINTQRRENLINNYEAVLESLDGYGNTEILLNSLGDLTKTSNDLKLELVTNSPLSNTVLGAILSNTQKFTEQDLLEVLTYNLPIESSLWDDIASNLFPILTNNSINLLKTLQYGDNEYETLISIEQQYLDELNNQQQILEEIVLTEIAEETPEQAAQKLAAETNANKQTAVAGYLNNGDLTNASNIIQNFNIENDADQAWVDFISIPLTLVQNNQMEWYNLSSTQLQTIENLATFSSSPKVIANARAILKLLYGTEYPMFEQNHNWNASRKSPRLMELQLLKKQTLQNPYPNPTHNEVNVPYYNENNECCIIITDLMGKVIKRFSIEKGYHVLNFTTEEFAAGMYLISLKDVNQKSLIVKKFIVQK
jgi:hypothetical protein